jgi:hypothetical protein
VDDPRPATEWPEHPYPGDWPDHSYVVDDDGLVHRVDSDADAPSGWVVPSSGRAACLDDWLRDAGRPPLAGRTAVLSFGSNRCPAKVVRQGGPFVNLACATSGLAAVWSHGTRRDGQVVATLVGAEEHEAEFFVSMCTEDDLALLDHVEGRGKRYDLVTIEPELVVLEDGTSPESVSAYVGMHPERWPVRGEDGHPIPLTVMTQEEIAAWRDQDPDHWEHDPDSGFTPLGD